MSQQFQPDTFTEKLIELREMNPALFGAYGFQVAEAVEQYEEEKAEAVATNDTPPLMGWL